MKARDIILGLIGAVLIVQLFTVQVLLLRNLRSAGAIVVKLQGESASLLSPPGPIEVRIVGEATTGPGPASKEHDLVRTGDAFDLAIDGHGFFKVRLPDGTIAYTRRGIFRLDRDGNLVTDEGYLTQPAITVPENYLDVVFSRDGTVLVTRPGSIEPASVGTVELARFINPDGLKPWRRNGLLLRTRDSGTPLEGEPGTEGFGTIEQGYLEAQFASSVS